MYKKLLYILPEIRPIIHFGTGVKRRDIDKTGIIINESHKR
jgi:hypothetical protein